MGDRQDRALTQGISFDSGQGAARAVQPGQQECRAAIAACGDQCVERLGRQLRRLRQQLDHAPAAETHAPQLVALARMVDRHEHRRVELERPASQPRGLLLQTATADETDGRAPLRDQQPCPRSPVRRSADRYHRRQCHALAPASILGGGLQDGVDLAHAIDCTGPDRSRSRQLIKTLEHCPRLPSIHVRLR
jgi:hypothetical protein